MTKALEEGDGTASGPGRFLPPGKTRYTLYRRLVGPQGRSGQVRNISLLPGFDPRTVQPVASRYTDGLTRLTNKGEENYIPQSYATTLLNNYPLITQDKRCVHFLRTGELRTFFFGPLDP